MGGFSPWHIALLALVVFLLFGKGKLSELMGDAAKGIKAFKKGMSDEEEAAAAAAKAAVENKPSEAVKTDTSAKV